MDHTGKPLGTHQGIAFYTPGQRRGLGISSGERLYVQRVQPATNTVVVGPDEALLSSECVVGDLNVLDPLLLAPSVVVEAKVRYATPATPATIQNQENGSLEVRFHTAQRALSPGQSAVFYRGDQLLGGGIIQSM